MRFTLYEMRFTQYSRADFIGNSLEKRWFIGYNIYQIKLSRIIISKGKKREYRKRETKACPELSEGGEDRIHNRETGVRGRRGAE